MALTKYDVISLDNIFSVFGLTKHRHPQRSWDIQIQGSNMSNISAGGCLVVTALRAPLRGTGWRRWSWWCLHSGQWCVSMVLVWPCPGPALPVLRCAAPLLLRSRQLSLLSTVRQQQPLRTWPAPTTSLYSHQHTTLDTGSSRYFCLYSLI